MFHGVWAAAMWMMVPKYPAEGHKACMAVRSQARFVGTGAGLGSLRMDQHHRITGHNKCERELNFFIRLMHMIVFNI